MPEGLSLCVAWRKQNDAVTSQWHAPRPEAGSGLCMPAPDAG